MAALLNKLLYATGRACARSCGSASCRKASSVVTDGFDSVQVTQHHRRLRSFYDSRHGGDAPRGQNGGRKMDETASNHYVKMALLAPWPPLE